ncbi:DUF362 domain-containing protein [Nanoarchaeota archaeon]
MQSVYIRSGKKKEGFLVEENLDKPLYSFLCDRNLRGRVVLVKPNMVDPTIEEACTSSMALGTIVDHLNHFGVDKVIIGGEPAAYVYERGDFDLGEAYAELGYFISGAEPVDLSSLPVKHFEGIRVSPTNGSEEKMRIPVYDTRGMVIISVSKPKEHGQYNFSGCVKNLMGLVPQNRRMRAFHHGFQQAAEHLTRAEESGTYMDVEDQVIALRKMKLQEDFVEQYCSRVDDKTRANYVRDAFELMRMGYLDPLSFDILLEHIVNKGGITGLFRHIMNVNPESFGVLDGSISLLRNEHEGEIIHTDFAAVGDIYAVDRIGMKKMGIPLRDVPYMHDIAFEEGLISEIGELGLILPTRCPKRKELFKGRHGLTFARNK